MKGIFDKPGVLKPSTMATVAQRRFEDAEALVRTSQNARANGAAYLAGFVIEILLKARLVQTYPKIANKRQHEVAADERELWELIWRRHDLEAMLVAMPQLGTALAARGVRDGQPYLSDLRSLCATWTIYARYSSRTMMMAEASKILERVRGLKELLR